MQNLILNKNLILIKKQVSQEQTIQGIIIPGKMSGIVSFGKIVAHGGIDKVENNESHNQNFIGKIEVGMEICYYNTRQNQIMLQNGTVKYHLIGIADIVYLKI